MSKIEHRIEVFDDTHENWYEQDLSKVERENPFL